MRLDSKSTAFLTLDFQNGILANRPEVLTVDELIKN